MRVIMTIEQCYGQIGVDYQGVLERLGSEAIVKKFVLKFPEDTSFKLLKESLEKQDVKEAFRAVHTLKGICSNLGFDGLYEASSALTEVLRAGSLEGTEALYQRVCEQYEVVTAAIREMQNEN